MPEIKYDVEALVKKVETVVGAMLEQHIGKPDELRRLHIDKVFQMEAVRFIYTESNAGADPQEIGIALAGGIAISLAHLAGIIEPEDRHTMLAEMLTVIQMMTLHKLAFLSEQEALLNGGEPEKMDARAVSVQKFVKT